MENVYKSCCSMLTGMSGLAQTTGSSMKGRPTKWMSAGVIAIMLFFVGGAGVSFGQVTLVDYPFSGNSPAPTNLETGLSATNYSVSAGSISFGSFQAATWTGSGVPYAEASGGWTATDASSGKYFSFTLETDGAESFDLSEISFLYRSTGAGPGKITITINGTEITTLGGDGDVDGANSNSTESVIESINMSGLTSAEVKIIGWRVNSEQTSGGGAFRIDDVQLAGIVELSEDPVISRSPSSLSGFSFVEGNGPSAEQSFTVEGLNLEDNITVAPPANYEISETSGSGFTSSNITLTETNGTVEETTIFVRLAAGLALGDYDETVTISANGVDDELISLFGSIVSPLVIPYSNSFRVNSDFDLAVNQGFIISDASQTTAAGGYLNISSGGYVETPTIDFTQFDFLETKFDLTTFGTGSNRKLSVRVSNDDGESFSTVETYDVPGSYVTFTTLIDLTDINDVVDGKLRIEMTDGTGGIRFRDFHLTDVIVADVELDGSPGFRMFSLPVEVKLSDFLASIWTQGVPNSDSPEAEEANVLIWDEGSGAGNWIGVDLETTRDAGTGILVYVFEDDDPTTAGITGGFPKTLSVSGNEFTAGTSTDVNENAGGWSLLGNPLAAPVSFAALNRSNLSDVVYVWDVNDETGDGGQQDGQGDPDPGAGSWKTWSVGSGTGDITGGIISSFQGFFVQNDEGGVASVSFPEGAKTTGGSFMGKEQLPEMVRLELSGQGMRNTAWLSFRDHGSMDKVWGDAHQLTPLSENYALLAGQKTDGLFDISVLPKPGVGFEFPLSVDATIGGTYTLRVTDFEFSGTESLLLKDRVNNVSVPLNAEMAYEFELESPAQKAIANPLALNNGVPVKAAADGSESRFVITASEPVNADAEADLPRSLDLAQNYPNPFNPTTVIAYDIPQESHVRVAVYDLLGREVAVLVNETRAPGSYNVSWDASALSSGVYVYRLEADGQSLTRRMTLVK